MLNRFFYSTNCKLSHNVKTQHLVTVQRMQCLNPGLPERRRCPLAILINREPNTTASPRVVAHQRPQTPLRWHPRPQSARLEDTLRRTAVAKTVRRTVAERPYPFRTVWNWYRVCGTQTLRRFRAFCPGVGGSGT